MKITITGIQIVFENKEEFIEFVNALKAKAEQFGLELILREKKREEAKKATTKKKQVVVV